MISKTDDAMGEGQAEGRGQARQRSTESRDSAPPCTHSEPVISLIKEETLKWADSVTILSWETPRKAAPSSGCLQSCTTLGATVWCYSRLSITVK